MSLALEEAKKSLVGEQWPVGVVLVLDGKIISTGHRRKNGHYNLDHAEFAAFRNIPDEYIGRVQDAVVYTNLEPCAMCFGAILNLKIRHLIFGLEDPYAGFAHLNLEQMPPRYRPNFPEIVGGVLREESRNLFKEFLSNTELEYWRNNKDNPLVKICME